MSQHDCETGGGQVSANETTENKLDTSEPARASKSEWLCASDSAFRVIHAQLVHLVKLHTIRPLMGEWETPTPEQLREFIEVAFWASLRSNEERPTRVHVAFVSRSMIPEAIALDTPVEYNEAQVAKLAHVVSADGSLLVNATNEGLRIWGLCRSIPPIWFDTVTVEVAGPGIIRVGLGPYQPFAVFCGRSVSIIQGTRISFADYLRRSLQKELSGSDFLKSQAEWRDCMVLAQLARMIVDEGHGGIILIGPPEDRGWLESLNPFAFRFAKPDSSIRDWIRRDVSGEETRAGATARIFQTDLSDTVKSLAANALAQYRWMDRNILRHVASLAGCDGAIVMTRDVQVLGFGAKLQPHGDTATHVCILGPEPGMQHIEASPLEESGGTRHQSALRFVSVHKDTVAIIISQDRHVSVAHWNHTEESVWMVQNADWWI
jgi:hypothetical protein